MTGRASFSEIESYQVTGVKVTDKELGHGSYATVQELEYMGLKCAGKKIHDLLQRQGDTSYTLRRFEEECRLLSQVRHPNIVQFLGVHFCQGVHIPILVMEFLPTNLTSCIEQYGTLPKDINYSILHDVALGLCYLHNQTPPIIHRDLSSNNVLLTANMTGKISDLGVARILNLTPLQVSRMTQTPGTPAYMPPEVMIANPKYDTSVDEFSYGILVIHVLSGRWPEPQIGPSRIEDGKLIPVTEAERREVFLQAIGHEHLLMDLILRCINNDPGCRAHANEIVERLGTMTLLCFATCANRLEMLRHIEHQEEENLALKEEKAAEFHHNLEQISRLSKEGQEIVERTHQLQLAYSSEVKEFKLLIDDLCSENQLLTAKMEADSKLWKAKVALYETQIDGYDRALKKEKDDFEIHQARERERFQTQIMDLEAQVAKQRDGEEADCDAQLTRERESCRRLTGEILQSRTDMNSLHHMVSNLEVDTSRKDATIQRNDTELEAQSIALKEKDSVISGMREQLTKTREYLTSKQQVVQADISWEEYAELPIQFSSGKSIVIDGKIYYGGGGTDIDDYQYTVYCYDPPQDTWTMLPPLPVRYYSLDQVNGKLVAVGGKKRSDGRRCNEVYTYHERSKKWKRTIPPMPTARNSPGVCCLQSALVVAGGVTGPHTYTDTVEVFKLDTLQWYRTDPLPTAGCNMSLVAVGNTCYAVGGYKHPSHLNRALYASVDDLLHNAVPANHTNCGDGSPIQSAWKALPDTPTYQPAAALLVNKLLAVGGKETSKLGTADMKEVYMYSRPTNSWIYISDLPTPHSNTTVAVLSSTEILVIGGGCDGGQINTVYKGSLRLKP